MSHQRTPMRSAGAGARPEPRLEAGQQAGSVGQAGLDVVGGPERQVGLHPKRLGAVGELVDEQLRVADLVAQDPDRVVDPDLAEGAQEAMLETDGLQLAEVQLGAQVLDLLALLLRDELAEPVADEAFRAGAEQLAEGGVDLDDPVVGIGDGHALGRAVHGHPELLLAARQLPLRAQLLGDIAQAEGHAGDQPALDRQGPRRDRHEPVGARGGAEPDDVVVDLVAVADARQGCGESFEVRPGHECGDRPTGEEPRLPAEQGGDRGGDPGDQALGVGLGDDVGRVLAEDLEVPGGGVQGLQVLDLGGDVGELGQELHGQAQHALEWW